MEWGTNRFFLPILYGISIWILLGIGGLAIAIRSLKREVY